MSVAMLSEQLVKTACLVHVFTTTANGIHELNVVPNLPINVDGVPVSYFKRITKDHTHFSPALLKALWRQSKSHDVIHIHAWWNLVSILSCFIALMRSVPVLVSARGTLSPYSFQNKNKGIKWLIHQLLSKPLLKRCHFHVTSDRENEAIKSVVKPKSITAIPNFVKLPANYPKSNDSSYSPFNLIFLSRIEEKKGLDILINALPFLKFPYSLTIAGDGDQDYIAELKALSKTNKVENNIQWVGFQNENKFELLQAHHLLVLPSHDENFGNVVIESLAVGTAVLISEQVGLADYVYKNQLGWVCQTNPLSVAHSIENIARQTTDIERIRLEAPGIITNNFNEDSLAIKYIGLYNKIGIAN
jgi:glycosyltransferase involved in cell wall biosynthesis